jgi:putative transcriptional regulator
VTEELTDYVLGTLVGERVKLVEAHLAGCRECRAEAGTLKKATDALGLSVPGVEPTRGPLDGVLAQLQGGGRFTHFIPTLSEFFDIPEAQVRGLLDSLLDPAAWQPGPAEGVELIPVEVGPRLQGAMAGFVRIQPGAVFPRHQHHGEELNFLLQGGFRENGRDVWRGDLVREPDGSQHSQLGLPGIECIAATMLNGQIELVEEPAKKRPKPPRSASKKATSKRH